MSKKITIAVCLLGFCCTKVVISNQDNLKINENGGRMFEQLVELEDYEFYFVVGSDDYITFYDADQLCKDKNMSLASLQDSHKDELLNQFIKNNEEFDVWLWTSARRSANSQQWFWFLDDDNAVEMTYTRWGSSQPDVPLHNDTCMNFMHSRGGWDDDLCEIKLSNYLCEILPESESPGPGGGSSSIPMILLIICALICTNLA